MSTKDQPLNGAPGPQAENKPESGPSGQAIGWAMVGGIGLLMLLGYLFR